MGARLVGGFRTVAYVENEPYAQAALMSNMRRGILDKAPIWSDVCTFGGTVLLPQGVDVLAGGFPCQDVSVAGKRAGIKGERSGLWFEYARLIREIRPRYVLVENVPGLASSGGLGDVLGSLAALGYDAEWWTLSAADIGAPHLRKRLWIVAHTARPGRTENGPGKPGRQEATMAYAQDDQQSRSRNTRRRRPRSSDSRQTLPNAVGESIKGSPQRGAERQEPDQTGASWWAVEPNVGRVAHGVAFRVQRLRLLGNGVVPLQSVPAWERIKELANAP